MKKSMKEIRKQYFIEAGKKVIKDYGIKNFSARKIGEEAGYSYATLYNYFKDLGELLDCSILSFLESICIEIRNELTENLKVKDKLIKSAERYIDVFIEHPNWFQIIFLRDVEKYPYMNLEIKQKILMKNMFHTELEIFVKSQKITQKEKTIIQFLIISSIIGCCKSN